VAAINLDTAKIFSTAGNVFYYVLIGLGVILVVGLVMWWLISKWRNKVTYITPVRLIRYLENGTKKEMNGLKGGKVQKGGIANFRIKIPKKFKKHDLGYIPDYSKADADGRLTFLVIGDGTLWQQLEETLQETEKVSTNLTEEQIEEVKKHFAEQIMQRYPNLAEEQQEKIFNDSIEKWIGENSYREKKLIMKPIPTDIKTVTVNNLQGWRAVLDKQKLTAFGIAIGGFIIMVIAHLISLYVQTKIKCPTP
jgi:hypothetical protein